MGQNWSILFKFIGKRSLMIYLALGLLSGLLTFLFVRLVSLVISLHISGEAAANSADYLVIFSFVILLSIIIRRALSMGVIRISQNLFWQIRLNIVSQILRTTWEDLVSARKDLHAAIISDVNVLTQASLNIIGFSTSFLLIIMCNGYLLSISLRLWAITLIATLLGAACYQIGSRSNIRNFEKARAIENFFSHHYNAILDGFKEIYINPGKGKQIYNEQIVVASNEAVDLNVSAFAGFLNNQIIGQTLFYLLLAGILTYLGTALSVATPDIVAFGFVLLYMLGAVESVMVLLPSFSRAQVAFRHLKSVEDKLKQVGIDGNEKMPVPVFPEFESIRMEDLEFGFPDSDNGFSVGPIDFKINRSEIVFVFGGNGSGKTTFIYLLLGLLKNNRGKIYFNECLLDQNDLNILRSHFTAVFSDFHLFDRILGVREFDEERCNYYLDLFEMSKHVKIENGKFSSLNFSTGQRKRLALIGALLERREILVLDEWAADQDPYFRRKFYLEILPILKEEGFTVIAITHDDKYFSVADRCYKMDFGKLLEVNVVSEF